MAMLDLSASCPRSNCTAAMLSVSKMIFLGLSSQACDSPSYAPHISASRTKQAPYGAQTQLTKFPVWSLPPAAAACSNQLRGFPTEPAHLLYYKSFHKMNYDQPKAHLSTQ
ncbi:hypothetical protein GOBAR_DD09056 [Gossypium barbadense]|nr:hypothetical protein GOBAR_DD09056 [Gossypium barbadense]